MSVTTLRAQKATSTPRHIGEPPAWTRPSAWLALPDISSTNNRFVGLYRIDADANFVSLSCTVTGGYTVDWGDGTTSNHASASIAYKQYTYSSIANTGESTLGYRQAIIQVYPQTAGNNITALTLQQRHNQSGISSYNAQWLELAVNASAMTSCTFGGNTVGMRQVQQVTIYQHAMTSIGSLFSGMRALQSIPTFNTASVTDMNNCFNGCASLTKGPYLDTRNVTTFANCFANCASLVTAPAWNTSAATNMSSMFSICTSLRSVPVYSTQSVTTLASVFNQCTSLQSVPVWNTSSVQTTASAFAGCSALRVAPAWNLSACTTVSGMFSGCGSLTSVPMYSTGSVTNFSTMFQNCTSLTTVPAFSTASATNMASMFSGCGALVTIPAFNVSSVALDGHLNMVASCPSLASVAMTGINQTISFANCKLSAAQLNAIYANLSASGSGKTITVTGNYGTTGHDPTIATAKGWTVAV